MLNHTELQRLRAAHTATLTDSCTVRRKVKVTTAFGGAADTWQVIATYACRVMPERDRRLAEVSAERELMTVYYRLTVPYDADLRADDEILCGGQPYQVVALWDTHTFRTARRAIIARIM